MIQQDPSFHGLEVAGSLREVMLRVTPCYNDLKALLGSLQVIFPMLFLYHVGEVRQEDPLKRRVVDSKPIQSYYGLTERGLRVAKYFKEIEDLL